MCEKQLAAHVKAKEEYEKQLEEYRKQLKECEKKLEERVNEGGVLTELMQNLRLELEDLQSRLQECTEASSGQLEQIAEMQKEATKAVELLRQMQRLVIMAKGAEGAQPEL